MYKFAYLAPALRSAIAGLLTATIFASQALAGVNLKNGNFYITYTDLIVGEPEFDVTRTYNSKAVEAHSFGYGWGSPIDTRLRVNGDGSVSVHENGSGAIYDYVAPDRTEAELDAALDKLLWGMERAGWLASDKARREMRAKLATDAEERRAVTKAMVQQGLAEPREIAIGERLDAARGVDEYVVREANGFYRRSADGYDRFDLNGYLVEVVHGRTDFRLRRAANGHLRQIETEGGSVIDVETDEKGRITRVSSEGMRATYKYDDRGRLLEGVNAVDTLYVYEYDDRSNMTAIRYEDGSSFVNEYSADGGLLISSTARDGTRTTYDYGDLRRDDPSIIEHFYTRVRVYAPGGGATPRSDEYTVYRMRADSFGARRVSEVLNGPEAKRAVEEFRLGGG